MNKIIDKYKAMPVTLKATLFFGAASFVTSGINYITTPIFTRLMSTQEYGIIAVYNSWHSIIQVFATMTLAYPGILNVGLYEHQKNRYAYLSSMLGIITCTSGSLITLYLLFRRQINALMQLPTSLIMLILLDCMLKSAVTLWTTKQRYEYRYKSTLFVSIGSAILAQIVSVIAVILLNDSGLNLGVVRLWSAGIVNLSVAVVLYAYILKRGRRFIDLLEWKATLFVALPLIPHYLSSVVLTGTDKIMISNMVGQDKTGIYSLAATLSSIGLLLWRALGTTFTPFINAKLGERNFAQIKKCTTPLLVVVGGACVMGALAAPEIIRLLATEEYLEGIYIVPPVVGSIFVHVLYDMFSAVAFFHKKSFQIMIASIVAAVSNIALNYFGILQFGYLAAGYTTLIANLILTGMHFINMRRIEKEPIYDTKNIFLLTLVVIALCLLCNFTYGLPALLRYGIIIALLIAMFAKRGDLIRTLTEMKV